MKQKRRRIKNGTNDVESRDFRIGLIKSGKDSNLPGYPHYNESEDILNTSERLPVDVENISPTGEIVNSKTIVERSIDQLETNEVNNDLSEIEGSDVTKDDLDALGDPEVNMDMGDDELLLSERGRPFDMTGEALDVPGSELDDENEDIGEEDEENNFYSKPD